MKVTILMVNDFPKGVFTTRDLALARVRELEEAKTPDSFARSWQQYYHLHTLVLEDQ